MIMGLKVVKCTHIAPLGLNRVQVTPASDLGFGWALVRSVLKNFSLGKCRDYWLCCHKFN